MMIEGHRLRQQAKLEIDYLADFAKSENKNVVMNRTKEGIFIGDFLCKMAVEKDFMQKCAKYLFSSKKHIEVPPQNLLEVYRAIGGVEKARQRIKECIRCFYQLSEDEKYYLDSILSVFLDFRAACSKSYIRKSPKPFFAYCCLCWRKPCADSAYYCFEHFNNKKLKRQDEAKLLEAVRSRQDRHSDNLKLLKANKLYGAKNINLQLFGWLYLFALPINHRHGNLFAPESLDNMSAYLAWIKVVYPNVFERIKNIEFDSFQREINMVVEMLSALDEHPVRRWVVGSIEVSESKKSIETKKIDDPKGVIYEKYDIEIVNAIFRRYEAYCNIALTKTKSGRKSDATHVIIEKYQDIVFLYQEQLKKGNKANYSDIARTLGCSRQHVSAVLKKISIKN